MGGKVSIFSATSLGGTLSVCGISVEDLKGGEIQSKALQCFSFRLNLDGSQSQQDGWSGISLFTKVFSIWKFHEFSN